MSIEKSLCSRLIQSFDFRRLFNEMGWDYVKSSIPVEAGGGVFALEAVAEKRGFAVFMCLPPAGVAFPDYNVRKTIDNAVTRLHFEHLIIYLDSNKSRQVWQLVIREHGKPSVAREIDYFTSQEPELLFQKLRGLFFSIDEEEKISLVDVKSAVHEQFEANAEKITKKFYEIFKKEHASFLGFIDGIDETVDREWYASLMLNRLMFIYFIQKKGFLDNNINYLRDKLKATQAKKGKNKFYSFYRNFLLVLFHKGLGSPERTPELEHELGRVPYLNGGLFDVHQIEEKYTERNIPDKAFERIFEFFDQYNWHLDTRITASGKDINPDVIGYIFEKYINDRAAMGAYYTKEDITEYIAKNCIVPYLFDEVKRKYPKSFDKESFIWTMLRESGDRYVYDAVKHGIPKNRGTELPGAGGGDTQHSMLSTSAAGGSAGGGQHLSLFADLPEEIAVGLDTEKPNLLERRKHWNRPAPPEAALPTEIWREVIERRKRYREVCQKIENGEITEINDFITHNLNIRQFAQDVIENIEDPDFIRHFYTALSSVTILDPTCGSGAFLFAALNILEPLYEASILRMDNYVNECRGAIYCAHDGRGPVAKKFKKFEEVLAALDSPQHPSRRYFIYKSIILNNLYGVDIMNEAVEIAKLRLFLKLVATVDVDYRKANLGLEPLPDIDFNIRAGNTLVGFVSLDDVRKAMEGKLGFQADELGAVEESAEYVKMAYDAFRKASLENDASVKASKEILNQKLRALNDRLNVYLAGLYHIHAEKEKNKYEAWLYSHKPFHWFSEYYDIVHGKGGFDVIIGNPPYVEYSRVKYSYTIQCLKTESCGNLFAYIVEQALNLLQKNAYLGLILQHSGFCTPRMESLIKLYRKSAEALFITFFECRPGKLFDGIDVRLAIPIMKKGEQNIIYHSGKYFRFFTEERNNLFYKIKYANATKLLLPYSFLKIENEIEVSIGEKLFLKSKKRISDFVSPIENDNIVYYSYGYRYWAKVLNYKPYFKGEHTNYSTGDKYLFIKEDYDRDMFVAILISSLFYWYYSIYSDGHNFTKTVIYDFPLDYFDSHLQVKLKRLVKELMNDLKRNVQTKNAFYKSTGQIEYNEYSVFKSKAIIDEIEAILSEHYGLSEEELDYIINYDIKYRMGKEEEV